MDITLQRGLIILNKGPNYNWPESVINYLANKHQTISDDYKTSDKQYSESCAIISSEIAQLFIDSGFSNPYIMKVMENTETGVKKLVPLIYDGRVSWGAHIVCGYGDKIFDPIIGHPISTKNYCKTVFGEDIAMCIAINQENIAAFLRR